MKIPLKSISFPTSCVTLLAIVFLPSFNINGIDEITSFSNEIESASKLTVLLIATVIISTLLPSNIRDSIIFTRFKKALPSWRIKKLLYSDHRFGRHFVTQNIPEIANAETPDEEHYTWLKMYKAHKDSAEVTTPHFWYLSLRDTFSSLVILTIYSLISAYYGAIPSLPGGWKYYLFTSAIVMFSARQNGNKLATNVVSASLN